MQPAQGFTSTITVAVLALWLLSSWNKGLDIGSEKSVSSTSASEHVLRSGSWEGSVRLCPQPHWLRQSFSEGLAVLMWLCACLEGNGMCFVLCWWKLLWDFSKSLSKGTEVKLITPFSKTFVALICIYSANKPLKVNVKEFLIHQKLFNSLWKSLTSFLRRKSCWFCTH